MLCKRVNREFTSQCMGELPETRLSPAPLFLFKPFIMKDTMMYRTQEKVYGLVLHCLVSRAVYLDLAEGYDTEIFNGSPEIRLCLWFS